MSKKSRRPPPKPAGPKNWAARAEGKVVVFTREQILIRLIDTAIFLWFHNGDMLSVHMLASASYKTLCDLTKKTGKVPWLTEIVGYEGLTMAYDFLRHAPSDPNVVLDFPPRANLTLLAGTVTTFEAHFGYRTNYMTILMLRFMCILTTDKPDTKAAFAYLAYEYFPEDFVIEDFAKLERVEFFDKALPVVIGRESDESPDSPN
jgi:hypothetical protein